MFEPGDIVIVESGVPGTPGGASTWPTKLCKVLVEEFKNDRIFGTIINWDEYWGDRKDDYKRDTSWWFQPENAKHLPLTQKQIREATSRLQKTVEELSDV